MKVLVTGGTGFIGSHAVEAMLAAGHRVRLLARTAAKVERVLGARGIVVDDVVLGDMVDEAAVASALHGCDAVLHAAASVGVASGDTAALAVNAVGTRNVVGQAAERGLDPIIYTSSVGTMLPPSDPVLTPNSPLAEPHSEYGRSKVEAEHFIQRLQREGRPITTFIIGGVYGPDQPVLDSALRGIVAAAGQAMIITQGGVSVIDVRDLARLIVSGLESGRGPRRYMASGQFLTWRGWTDTLNHVVGREVREIHIPAWLMTTVGRALDLAKRIKPFDYPLTYEAALFMTSAVPGDDSATIADLGVVYRSPASTLEDSTRWLIREGHLAPDAAPRLRDT